MRTEEGVPNKRSAAMHMQGIQQQKQQLHCMRNIKKTAAKQNFEPKK